MRCAFTARAGNLGATWAMATLSNLLVLAYVRVGPQMDVAVRTQEVLMRRR